MADLTCWWNEQSSAMKRQLGILPKLTLIFVLFAGSLLSGLGLQAYRNGRAALDEAIRSELLSKAMDEEAALNSWVDERMSRLSALASTPSLIEHLEALAPETDSLEGLPVYERLVLDLKPRTGPGQPFLTLFIIEPEMAQIIVSTIPEEEGKFRETLPYFINGLNGPYVQNVYYSTTSQGPAMTVSAPMHGSNGRLLGVLAGHLNLDEMNAIIQQRTGLRQSDEAFLVNSASLFVTQPRLSSDPAVLQRGIHTEAADRCVTRTEGTVSAPDYRGVPAITVYRWLPEREVCLIVKIDQAEAFAPIYAFGRTLMLGGGLVLILASVLAFWLARTFTSPILALNQAAEEFGAGNFSVRVPETATDELGALARAFNRMAASLSEKDVLLRGHAEELEHKIKERTQDLHASEAELRALFAAMPDLILVLDSEGRYLKVAPTASDLLYDSIDELVGQTIHDVMPPELNDNFLGWIHTALQTGQTVRGEYKLAADDDELWFVATISPMTEDSVVWVARNVTTRKQAEANLARQTEELRQSQALLKRTEEIARIGSWRWDLVTQKLAWSDGMFLLFDVDQEGFDGDLQEVIKSRIHPDDQMAVANANAHVLEDATPQPLEYRIVRPDGQECVVWAEGRLEYNEAGDAVSLIGYVRDITDAKRAEERQRFLDEVGQILAGSIDYETTLHNVADLAVSRNADWCVVYLMADNGEIQQVALTHVDPEKVEWAKEFQRRVGSRPDQNASVMQVIQSGKSTLIPYITDEMLDNLSYDPELRQAMAELNLTAAMTVPLMVRGQALGAITFISAQTGRLYDLDDLDLAQELARRAAVSVDNARLHRKTQLLNAQLEQHVEERTAELQKANQELESFSYSVSHDLRAPLRAIDGFSRILLEDYAESLPADATRYLGLVRNNTQQMGMLVDDLLAFSRLGRHHLNKQTVSVTELVQRVLVELKVDQQGRQVEITIGELPTCQCDPALLKQVFVNLLANALKFSRTRAVAQIEIGYDSAYFVRDNGVGFDMKYADKLFGVFQRLHRAEEYEGTGVGLAIVKRIIDRHGGDVWAEAELNQGATFYFSL